ncbi:TPD1 protein homolog 1B-like [Phragmites australis]|uniref:TPD1 protein homolog 1B-like n=1 Tax=Phragmites australis TaxID=29695 RepID=UPI002D77CF63|nr:TPD1 protein homolog 1B-like [Phragmites australis]
MESMLKMFAFLLLCCLCSGEAGGAASCPLSSIVVTQSGTGGWAHGQPVYAVAVRNTCSCAQSDVRVACGGFVTTLAVDPSKLMPIGGGLCLVNGGGALVRGRDVTFSYASEKQFGFGPVSSTVAC